MVDAINNQTKSDLEIFKLQHDKFKSCLHEQFHFFKQSFITEVSQFKSDVICTKSTHNDENTIENHHREYHFIRWTKKLIFYMKN